ncbi:TetR family transcriptional regulator C-terminal domain-containing protein, partial [Escherichia coli]
RELPRQQAQEAGYGLAALIDGLWLRAALSGKPLDKPLAHSLTRHFITQHLPTD